MKIPLKWLADYVPLDLPVAELAAGSPWPGWKSAPSAPRPARAGGPARQAGGARARSGTATRSSSPSVLGVEKHPNADKLKLPTVEYGEGRAEAVVTGAPNINVGDSGQKVVLGLTGTVLLRRPRHAEAAQGAEADARSAASPATRWSCPSFELGITEEHEGIILLEDDAPVGMPLADFMGDIVLEVDVLPNMARCLSMIGVAREVAALTGQQLQAAAARRARPTGRADRGPRRGRHRGPEAVGRATPPALIEGVKIGPAPGWMQRRLTYAGMRPISNIVDITNYVMLEWGQPLHAFDYDVLVSRAGGKAPTIIVRPAQAGEVLEDARRPGAQADAGHAGHRRRGGADRPGRRHGRGRRRR